MASEEEDIPKAPEIRKQVARMLRSQIFRESPSQAKVLKFVVTSALKRKEISRRHIDAVLFPRGHHDPGTSVGRSTASNLRHTLIDYYAQDGANDLVRIDLPRGPGYKPRFSFQATSGSQLAYSRGVALLSQMLPEPAAHHFIKAIELEPAYVAPYLALAEASLMVPLQTEISPLEWFPRWQGLAGGIKACARLPEVRELVSVCLDLSPRNWHVHAVCGAMHSYEHQWDKAAEAFETAMAMSPDETQYYPWYLAFLAARGKLMRALEIMSAKVRQEQNNPAVLVQYGFLLYAGRQFSKAHSAFVSAGEIIGRVFYPKELGLACLSLQDRQSLSPFLARGRMRSVNKQYSFPRCFPGLFVLVLAHHGDQVAEARKMLREMEPWPELSGSRRGSPMQFALAYMALGQTTKAIKELFDASDECDPLTMWLHILPIFDPLRKHKQFGALIKRIGLVSEDPDPL